jgi:hypothetical protein
MAEALQDLDHADAGMGEERINKAGHEQCNSHGQWSKKGLRMICHKIGDRAMKKCLGDIMAHWRKYLLTSPRPSPHRSERRGEEESSGDGSQYCEDGRAGSGW